MSKNTAIGIDLGTSYSLAGCVRKGQIELIPNLDGATRHASVVSFIAEDGYLVGNRALNNLVVDPARTINHVMRLLGQYHFSQPVKAMRLMQAYETLEGPNHEVRLKVGKQIYSVSEVAGIILSYLKVLSEMHLKTDVQRAVITIPACFNVNQRHAVIEAARIAGFDGVRLVSEPMAAALAFGQGQQTPMKVAVFHLGAGTFDISVISIDHDVYEVMATAGNSFLGGINLTNRMIHECIERIQNATSIDFSGSISAYAKLRHLVERAKSNLASSETTEIVVGKLIGGGEELKLAFSRTELAVLAEDIVPRCMAICDEALREAQIRPEEIDHVICVGGSTLQPHLPAKLTSYFGKPIVNALDPLVSPVQGASLFADALWGNPTTRPIVIDVMPYSLRLATTGGYTVPVIDKNTPFPFDQTRTFTTNLDQQRAITLKVFQGEGRRQKENELLGEFVFSQLEAPPAGRLELATTFSLSRDGRLNVSAYNPYSKTTGESTIGLTTRMSEQEIESLLNEHPLYTLSDGTGVRG